MRVDPPGHHNRLPRLRAGKLGLPAVLLAAVCPTVAEADTVTSGWNDANRPGVIAPSDDPINTQIDMAGAPAVMFIQKMPVGKRVRKVTLGDLARGASCTQDAALRVYVREHPAGDLNGGSTQIAYSTATMASLDAAKLTFTLSAPITMKEGRGYSFLLGYDSAVSPCRFARLTTWAHNEQTINPGPSTCTRASYSHAAAYYRTWHTGGASDRDPACTQTYPYRNPPNFDPSMPEGWLHVRSDLYGSRYIYRQYFSGPAPSGGCGTGTEWAHWRGDEHVCRWKHYASPGEEPADGWYYAMPWLPERGHAPSDIYMKLETIDYETSLSTHVPILLYDSAEQFHALSPAAITDFHVDGILLHESNTLQDGQGVFAVANAGLSGPNADDPAVLSLDYLRPVYPEVTYGAPQKRRSGSTASGTDWVSARGDYLDGTYDEDSATMESRAGYANRVYARAAHGHDGRLWLQYWFFYYYNALEVVEFGLHEGDWEMIQIGLSGAGAPELVAYAQHNGGELCEWAQAERSGSRPVVYIARDSHASYFGSDRVGHILDRADGLGGGLFIPVVEELQIAQQPWLTWPGRWGDSGTSPAGPAFQNPKWDDPTAWADSLGSCSA